MNKRLRIVVILFLVAGGSLFFLWHTNAKRSAILNIDVTPLSAIVKLNGKQVEPGNHSVEPGSYKVTVSLDGFVSQTETITASAKKTTYVGVALQPNSSSTFDWYANHTEDGQALERITGKQSSDMADKALELAPIIKELPFVAPGEEFRIDYGAVDKNGRPKIVITAATQVGYDDALQWMTARGYDTSVLTIEHVTPGAPQD